VGEAAVRTRQWDSAVLDAIKSPGRLDRKQATE